VLPFNLRSYPSIFDQVGSLFITNKLKMLCWSTTASSNPSPRRSYFPSSITAHFDQNYL